MRQDVFGHESEKCFRKRSMTPVTRMDQEIPEQERIILD
jgi:hypothetical protein